MKNGLGLLSLFIAIGYVTEDRMYIGLFFGLVGMILVLLDDFDDIAPT